MFTDLTVDMTNTRTSTDRAMDICHRTLNPFATSLWSASLGIGLASLPLLHLSSTLRGMNSTSSPGSRSGLPGRLKRPRLYEQLAEHISNFIEAQGLSPGDRLPPERSLAAELGRESRVAGSSARGPRDSGQSRNSAR